MDLYEVADQIVKLLQQRGKLTYRVLKRQFELDDDVLEDLKEEILYTQPEVIDDEGKGLIWTGETAASPATTSQLKQHAPIVEPTEPAHVETPPVEPRAPEAERRQLTVLFCDLVESTALSGRLDPEDLREVIRSYQAACAEVIKRFDGHVAQLLGDGLLVYVGYPQAHEDDAQRAVRAGLGMLEAMGALNSRLQGVALAIRVGIHTGLVVVGEMGGEGRQEQLALGETPNIAARIQGLAEPNTVVMSAATSQLVQGFFHYEDLGEQHLRGVAQPIHVHRVLQETGAQSRLDIASTRGLTPLVGRESEVSLLLDRWEQTKNGSGQVVLLSGEAGIGKSRLVQALKEHVASRPHARLECRSSPYYQNTALYPIANLLQRTMRWEQDDTTEAKLRKLQVALERYDFALDETMPLFATLLSLPLSEDRYPPAHLTPQRQRQKTLDTLVAMFVQESERHPVLFIVEDLHWTDPTTLECLELLMDQSATASILTLLTCRPEFEPPWSHRSYLSEVSLNRLFHSQIELIATQVAGGKTLPAEITQQLVDKTDGVPLYIEELTKTMIESGVLQEAEGHYVLSGPLNEVAIPATLNDSLMARLDRLPMVREIAQLGAVIGREFAYDMLYALANLEESVLQDGLSQLVDHELLYQRGRPPQATYTFKHALVQDAAYQSLLRRTRQQIHERIAQLLEASFPEVVEAQPEVVAHHYSEARQNEKAIGYWQQAGRRAIQRSANQEAIHHLHNALELIAAFPNRMEYVEQELDIQITLGPALMAIKGIGSPEVEATYARARELCQHIGATAQLFLVMYGLWRFYNTRATYQTAKELGEQLITLSQDDQNPARAAQAHQALGFTLLYLGELTVARVHLEQAVAFSDRTIESISTLQASIAPGVTERSVLAQALWSLGYPDQSFQWALEARAKAQEVEHFHSLALSLFFAARVHNLRREALAVLEQSTELVRFAADEGFVTWIACGNFMYGVAQVTQGEVELGLGQMRQGLREVLATGSEIFRIPFLIMLSDACYKAGQGEEGLAFLAAAMTAMEETGRSDEQAEAYRLQGELLLLEGIANRSEAEAHFQQALEIARRQEAKSWELRAATSLARLWQSRGKRQEAYGLLDPVYNWFTEGFDTADLQDAKTLLNELSMDKRANR